MKELGQSTTHLEKVKFKSLPHTIATAKSLNSRVQLCETPSLGFSRQEHWSGLPFPSPMHKTEKWKWSHSVMSDSSWPHEATRLLDPWDFPGKSTRVGCHCLLWPHTICKSNFQVNPKKGALFFKSYEHMENHRSKYSYNPTVQEVFLSKTRNHKPLRKKNKQ